MAQKVILDVDTGADDAAAILLAGHHPALELAAVTVAHGNAPLSTTLENTLRTMSAGALEHVPVYSGAALPLVHPMISSSPTQEAVLPLAETSLKPQPQHAVQFLIDYYMSAAGPETIYLPVGPHTNLALALRIEPRLAQRIPRIVTMGGAYTQGNYTPSAEFNILADPEAAFVVWQAGIPITMIGLEVTDAANSAILIKGLDPAYGARPLRRAIQHMVEDVVTDMLLREDVNAGDTVLVDASPDQELVLTRKQ